MRSKPLPAVRLACLLARWLVDDARRCTTLQGHARRSCTSTGCRMASALCFFCCILLPCDLSSASQRPASG